jgi:hypothetical protein
MTALIAIGWALWLLVAVLVIFELVGFSGLARMFPEGRRAWQFPAQLASLGHFAAVILLNPWR